ncbi:MAG: transporter substrate-binding domain-containing protein [Magnetococcales bacterium]|nr:transporter substrate-binding domain-containing protein [Magnetococcales bacterium]
MIVNILCWATLSNRVHAIEHVQSDVIEVGSELDYPPFAVVDGQGEADGFTVDLFKAVAKVMGLKVHFRVGPWDEVRTALERGELDALPLVSYSQERDKLFDFTTPHTVSYATAFVRDGDDLIQTEDQMHGLKIIAMRADATHDYLVKHKITDHLILAKTVADVLRLLASGKGDMALAPRLVGLLTIQEFGLKNLISSNLRLNVYGRGYGFAVKEGDSQLLDHLNQGLSIVKASGVYDQLYDKWFGVVDPKGLDHAVVKRYAIIVSVIVVGFFLLVIFWFRILKRQVKLRTKELFEANKALQKSEARFADLYDHAPDMYVSVVAATGTIRQCNQTLADKLGYHKSEIVGRSILSLYHPDSLVKANEVFHRFVETGEVHNAELQLQCKTGEKIDVTLNVTAVRDDAGKVLYSRSCWIDISNRKRMEEQLRSAMQAAQWANQAKSAFLAHMSHEMRTPLNSIIGMGDLLEETELNEVQKKYLAVLVRSGTNLLAIINDVLDLSKIEAGELVLESAHFSIKKLLEEVEEIFALKAKDRDIALTINLSDTLPAVVVGDTQRLKQILINLLGNAMKFTVKGSVVVHVSRLGDDLFQFDVTDTGIGISDGKLKTIFEPFVQADVSTTRKYGGTGLGLSICQQLLEQMKGHIWAVSHKGQGSTFSFKLPLIVLDDVEIDHEEKSRPAPQLPVAKDPYKVLLVDDAEDNRLLIQAFLKKGPFVFESACNGAEAVQKYMSGHFDLVLMDIQMPIMDGFTATKAIRNWELENKINSVPVIALTAFAMNEDKEKALEAGCNIHLGKPIKKGLLFATMIDLLEKENVRESNHDVQ